MPQAVVLAGRTFYPQEKLAGETGIFPGMLLTFGSSGTANKLLRHATAGGDAVPMFADINTTPDRSVTTEPVATAYGSGESVKWFIAERGTEVYAWVPASASAIIVGNMLMSNGDGTLKLYAAQTVTEAGTATAYTIKVAAPVAMAAESLDNSAVATASRIRVYAI